MTSCITSSANALSNSLIQTEQVSSTVFLPNIKNSYQAQIDHLLSILSGISYRLNLAQRKETTNSYSIVEKTLCRVRS
jgi:hypothetical protein